MPRSTHEALAPYRTKRDFERTREPAGTSEATHATEQRSYVIQKHAASRLHYDFRLELDGVLKSWAVPKGPSLVAGQRRLAVAVEDHPVEYGAFEGVIPAGEYGGGTVLLWDRGTWTPIGDPHVGLARGKLEFELHGEKLHGRFVLVRLRDEESQWLLLKSRDEHAQTEGAVIDAEPRSVATQRDLSEIAADAGVTPKPAKKTAAKKTAAKKYAPKKTAPKKTAPEKTADAAPLTEVPEFVEPQLATAVPSPPATDAWLHEIKLDGYRLQCRIDGDDVQIWSRNHQRWTTKVPALAAALRELDVRGTILDGELVHLDERGRSNFSALVAALGDGARGLVYHAFDLLFSDGHDLRREPLVARKRLLEALCRRAPANIRYTDHVVGRGDEFLEAARVHGTEGIVSKRVAAPYVSGRGRDWAKIKLKGREELVIVGYTPPKHARDRFGALLLAVHAEEGWRFAGKVGTGFSTKTRPTIHTALEALHVDACPLVTRPRGPGLARVQWVRPELVAEIEFTEWTPDGHLRHPSFQGLRTDKPASQVRGDARPTPRSPTPKSPRSTRPAKQPSRAVTSTDPMHPCGVTLTHPDKVLVADVGLTKLALARYYESVADAMLPHLQGRPLMLLRCPDGSGKPCFYQKHAGNNLPEGIATLRISEDVADDVLVVEDNRGLVGTVQMGALELHVWGSRREQVEHPDRIVIDLDPDTAVGFADVVVAAREVRDVFTDAGLVTFVMSTGGKGLHVVAPIEPVVPFAEIKAWTRELAAQLVRGAPKRFVATASKARRRGKIFVDYLRNGRGATAICPYSTRARPGAPVAVPMHWDELDGLREPPAFDIAATAARVADGVDPWPEHDGLVQRIASAAE